MDTSLRLAAESGLRHSLNSLIEKPYDVDTPDDLARLREDLARLREGAALRVLRHTV